MSAAGPPSDPDFGPSSAPSSDPGSDPEAPVSQEPGACPGERSVTIGGDNNAPITTGDNSPVHHTTVTPRPLTPAAELSATARPVGLPARVWGFVGRGEELAGLERALASSGPGVVVQAVHGLGGIGKSALAAEYVRLHARKYTQVVWISAETTTKLEAGLQGFADKLDPQPKSAVLPSEVLVERAKEWLATHDGWLLVLDNVNARGDISALLNDLDTGTGRFLITSRRAINWNLIGATVVRLGVLKPDEALALLAATIGTTPDTLDGGAELCEELGHLPLAIAQAGAYIAQNQPQNPPGARDYLSQLADHPAPLYARGDEDTDSERTIARIWHITLDRLTENTPLAGEILRVLAWYAPDAIPTSLLDPLAPSRTWARRSGSWPPTTCSPTPRPTAPTHRPSTVWQSTAWYKPSPATPTPTTRTASPPRSPRPATRPPRC